MKLLFLLLGITFCHSAVGSDRRCDIDLIGDYKVTDVSTTLNRQRLYGTATGDQKDKESIKITCPDSMSIDGYYENEIGHLIRFSGPHRFNNRELTVTCHCSTVEQKAGLCYYEPRPTAKGKLCVSPLTFEQLILKEGASMVKNGPYFAPVRQVTQIRCNMPTRSAYNSLCSVKLSADAVVSPKSIVNKAQSKNHGFATRDTNSITISCPKSMTLFGIKRGYSAESVRKINFFTTKIELFCECSKEKCNFQPKEKLLVGILDEKTASIDEYGLYNRSGNARLTDITRVYCSNREPPPKLTGRKGLCVIELLNQAYVTSKRNYVENQAKKLNADPKRYFATTGTLTQISVHCPNKFLLVNDERTRILDESPSLIMCILEYFHDNTNYKDTKKQQPIHQVICMEPWRQLFINPFKTDVKQTDSNLILKPTMCSKDRTGEEFCRFSDLTSNKLNECSIKLDQKITIYSSEFQMKGFKKNKTWILEIPHDSTIDLQCPEGSPFLLDGSSNSADFMNSLHHYRSMTVSCKCDEKCAFLPKNIATDKVLSWNEVSNEIQYSLNGKHENDIKVIAAKCGPQSSTMLQETCSFEVLDEKLRIESPNPHFLNEEDVQIFGGRPNLFTTRQPGHIVTILCPENYQIKLSANRLLSDGTFETRNDWLLRQIKATKGFQGSHLQASCQCDVADRFGHGCNFKPLDIAFGSLRTSIWPPATMTEHRNSKNDPLSHATSAICVPATKKTNKYDSIEFQKMGKSCGLAFGNGATYNSNTPNRAKDRKSFFSTSVNKAALTVRCAAPNALMIHARFTEKLRNGKTRHTGRNNAKLARTAITLKCVCNPKKNNCAFYAPAYKYGEGPNNTILFKKIKTSMTTVSLVYCERRID